MHACLQACTQQIEEDDCLECLVRRHEKGLWLQPPSGNNRGMAGQGSLSVREGSCTSRRPSAYGRIHESHRRTMGVPSPAVRLPPGRHPRMVSPLGSIGDETSSSW
jgi:hypothetical protein